MHIFSQIWLICSCSCTVHSLVVCSRCSCALFRRLWARSVSIPLVLWNIATWLLLLRSGNLVENFGLYIATWGQLRSLIMIAWLLLLLLLIGSRQECSSLLDGIEMPLFSDSLASLVHMDLDHSNIAEAWETELFPHCLQAALLYPREQNAHIFKAWEQLVLFVPRVID